MVGHLETNMPCTVLLGVSRLDFSSFLLPRLEFSCRSIRLDRRRHAVESRLGRKMVGQICFVVCKGSFFLGLILVCPYSNDTEPPTKRVKYTQTSSEDAIVFQASRDQVIADAVGCLGDSKLVIMKLIACF